MERAHALGILRFRAVSRIAAYWLSPPSQETRLVRFVVGVVGLLMAFGPGTGTAKKSTTHLVVTMDLTTHGPEESQTVPSGTTLTDVFLQVSNEEGSYSVTASAGKGPVPPLDSPFAHASVAGNDGAQDAIDTSPVDKGPYRINPAIRLKSCWVADIVVSRVDTGNERTWKHTLKTPCGEWRTGYGFTFVPNRDKNYFSEKADDAFVIARTSDREELDYLPSIFFHWADPERSYWAPSWTAGLGSDLEEVALLIGLRWDIHENVGATIGLAIHERSDLVGKYEVGDSIAEALDPEQLVSESFVPNIYLGVAFRFGTNVHSEREAASKVKEKARVDATVAAAKNACTAKAAEALKTASGKCEDMDEGTKAGCYKAANSYFATELRKCG
ncbi:MAG: hypothetical protein K8J08_14505 [Thermoanaerobaculia bacterium]|nr:hypothetical protein [Thermoanaerobaculia bacterium]